MSEADVLRAPNKYRAQKINSFHSKREYRRAQELELLQKCGAISELRHQVKYEIIPKCGKNRECSYVADFVYIENGQTVVEDAKGYHPPVYNIKRKLMKWVHGIDIKET